MRGMDFLMQKLRGACSPEYFKRHPGLLRKAFIFITATVTTYILILAVLSGIYANNTPLVYRTVQGLVWKGGYTFRRFNELKTKEPYDVLVFGSSTANRSIHPEVFQHAGISLYNLGTDDQTPVNTEVLVKYYCERMKPKLVILDIYDRVFAQSGVESAADVIQNCNSNKVALKMALAVKDLRAVNMVAVRLLNRNEPPFLPADEPMINGFRPLKRSITNFHPEDYRYVYNERQWNAFRNTLKYLDENKIQYVLVIQPKPVYYLEENKESFLTDLEPVVDTYNSKLYDFTIDDAKLTMQDYADLAHLNERGAVKYSSMLLNRLGQEKLLSVAKEPSVLRQSPAMP